MKEGHEYFARQEEEISNKYMSANGDGNMQIDIPKATGLDSITNKIFLGGAIFLGIGIALFIYKKIKK
tara:strand:- start:46 stop:249 length:204 start_codon:yes stop_codon:yes gene_type:complete